jgi:hypothetical protein
LFICRYRLADRTAREVSGRQEAGPEGHARHRRHRPVAWIVFVVKTTGATKTFGMEGRHRRPVRGRANDEPFRHRLLHDPTSGYVIHADDDSWRERRYPVEQRGFITLAERLEAQPAAKHFDEIVRFQHSSA